LALIDILGFSDYLKSRGIEKSVAAVRTLMAEASRLTRSGFVKIEGASVRDEVLTFDTFQFSDTILMWTPPITPGDRVFQEGVLTGFLLNLCGLISIGLRRGLPLRLGISYGDLYVDGPVIVGEPVIEAYIIEKSQEWVGGAAGASCIPTMTTPLVTYPVPTKKSCGPISLALDWTLPVRLAMGAKAWDPAPLFAPFLEENVDRPKIRIKYEHALAFAQSQNQIIG
jgi:hypothetical protein